MFAELVARAIEEDGFEQVIVDLPFFLNKGGVWEEAVKQFPHVSSLYFRIEDGRFAAILFTPSDAVSTALSSIQILREWGNSIDLQCIDDSRVIHYPKGSLAFPDVNVGDDYSVFIQGLAEYFNCLYDQLDGEWKEVSKDQRFFNEYRAGLISDRLRGYLRGGKKTLFVCEYRLWWLASKMFINERPVPEHYFSHPWKDVKAVLVVDSPLKLWVKGALDDYPAVVYEFYNNLRKGITASFDKLAAAETILNRSFHHDRDHNVDGASLRRVIIFYQYLRNRLLSECRLTPLVLRHLYDAAYSCLGKKMANSITKNLLFYPQGKHNRKKNLSIREDSSIENDHPDDIRKLSKGLSSMSGENKLPMDTLYDGYRKPVEELQIISRLYPRLESNILTSEGEWIGITWSIKADYYQYELAAIKLRNVLAGRDQRRRIIKSSGSIRNGIHWKATINARALKEDTLYVKHKYRQKRQKRNKLDEFTPVTFIFTDDFRVHWYREIYSSNRSRRYLDLNPYTSLPNGYPPPDLVINALYSLYDMKELSGGHIVKRAVSSITLLYNKRVVDDARYDAISSRRDRFPVRCGAITDTELISFSIPEKGIAWAVKYAEHTVVVAAKPGWKPSQSLAEFSRQRNIEIAHVPLSVFQKEFIGRLKTMYFTSTAIKRRPDRDEIVGRFIE